MLFMDLTVDGSAIVNGWPCFGNIPVLPVESYLRLYGAFCFVDTQGLTDPDWQDLNARYLLLFASDSGVVVPLQQVPVQNLSVPIATHNYALGLYEMPIDTTIGDLPLPTGADAGYVRQQLFSFTPPPLI